MGSDTERQMEREGRRIRGSIQKEEIRKTLIEQKEKQHHQSKGPKKRVDELKPKY